MEKKNHALRNFAITAIVGTVVALVLVILGTVLAGSLGDNAIAIHWVKEASDFGAAGLTIANGGLWSFQYLVASIIWYVSVAATVVFFLLPLILALNRKKGKLVGVIVLNLVLCLVLLYLYLALYYGQYVNSPVSGTTLVRAFFAAIAFHYGAVAAIFAILVAAAGIVAIVGVVGMFFATLRAIGKKEKKVEEPAEEPEREKGLLVVKQYDKEGQVGPCVEKKPCRYPYVSLTPEEIKAIVREEVEQANDEEAKKIFKSPIVFAIPTQVKEVEPEQPEEEPVPVVEEKPVEEKPAEEQKESLSEEQIRLVVAQEIAKAIASLKLARKPAKAEEPVQEVKEEPVQEEPAPVVEEEPVQEPVEEPVQEPVQEEPAPVVEEEPVQEEQPEEIVVEEEPVQEEPQPLEEEPVFGEAGVPVVEEGKTIKAVRIPFTDRLNSADDSLKAAFNEIKSLLKAYGLNDRVSNGGDSFRLHRVTYCKVTVAGKALKLYLALNPADYANSTYPVKDASSKAMYAETPLVFKVKSGLSLRRAEELIRDCMDKNGLEQVDKVEPRDWVAEIANAEKEEGEADDEE